MVKSYTSIMQNLKENSMIQLKRDLSQEFLDLEMAFNCRESGLKAN